MQKIDCEKIIAEAITANKELGQMLSEFMLLLAAEEFPNYGPEQVLEASEKILGDKMSKMSSFLKGMGCGSPVRALLLSIALEYELNQAVLQLTENQK